MKITVEIDGKRHPAKLPYPHAKHVIVEAVTECPACKFKAPLGVSGAEQRIESHDTYAAEAFATCCKTYVGTVRAQMSTIFGLEEDERVLLHGRCRVY